MTDKHTDRLGEIRVSIPIQLRFVVTLVVLGLIGGFAFFTFFDPFKEGKGSMSNRQKVLSLITYITGSVSAGGGVLGAIYVGKSIENNAKQQRIDRTLHWIAQWSNPEFDQNRTTLHLIRERIKQENSNGSNATDADIINQLFEEQPELRLRLVSSLNFLESIAICLREGIVDEKLIRQFYRSIVTDYNKTCEGWIIHRQGKRNNKKLFCDFMALAKKYERTDNLEKD